MKKDTKVIFNSLIYTFNAIAINALSVLLLPIYTRHLTTADYGVQTLSARFNNVATYLIALCLYSAVARFYAECNEDDEKVAKLFGTLIFTVLGLGTLFLTICTLLQDSLVKVVFDGTSFFPAIFLSLISMLFASEYTMYQRILQSRQESVKTAVVGFVYFFAHFLFAIYFVSVKKMGVVGVFTANSLTNILATVYMLFDLKKRNMVFLGIDFALLKNLLKYSIPLIPHNVTAQIYTLISSILISTHGSLSAVGLFGIASQIGSIADTTNTAFNNAYNPWFFDILLKKSDNYKQDVNKLTNIIICIVGIVMIGLSYFSQEVIILICDVSYHPAWVMVPLIVIGFVIKIPYYFYITVLFFYKSASKYIFIATSASTLLGLILAYCMIPYYGVWGAIIANIAYIFLQTSIIIFISRRIDNVGFKIKNMLSIVSLIIGWIIIGVTPSILYSKYQLSIYLFIYKVLLVIGFVISSLFINWKNAKDILKRS